MASNATKATAGIALTGAAAAGIFALGLAGDMTLTNVALSTNAVDVDAADATVTCNMTVTTTGVAVGDVGCTINPPAGSPIGCTAHSHTADVWSCDMTIPRYAESGTWSIDHITIRDVSVPPATSIVTNADILAEPDLCAAAQCVAGDLNVVVTSTTPDTTGPGIQTFTALPIDPAPGDTVACGFVFNPAETPIGDVSCTFTSSESYALSCTGHGVDTCNLDLPVGADAGVTWSEVNHVARDLLGNSTLVEGSSSFLVSGASGCDGLAADYTANAGWSATTTETPASDTLTIDFYARPAALDQNALVAFAQNTPVTDYADAAMIVRFGNAGIIEVRDGSGYGCPGTTCPTYVASVWYHFSFVANITAGTYTVTYEACDSGMVALATDADFRTGAPGTSIGYHAAWDSTGNDLDVDMVTWTPGACDPLTCAEQGFDCETADDTCGGTATPDPCGTCSGPDVCVSNVCCTPSTTVCTDPDPDYECGDWADGCGGTVNCDPPNDGGSNTCDDRVPGEICVAGECVDPGTALEPENTQGDTWETIYENCTGDDYPAGYRPPIYVRPTLQNTGVNCPDKTSGCPADATLTPLGTNSITTPGLYENFTVTGQLNIEANDVTLRNFEVLCTAANGAGIEVVRGFTGTLIEYGTIRREPGSAECGWNIWPMGGETQIRYVHTDQCGQDCMQSTQVPGPILIERSLHTRVGDNGGYGSSAHADTWQYYNNTQNQHACWLGSRVVPSYCPNFYKNSNITQSGWDTSAKWYLYNNWFDASTNVMIAGDGARIRNNKFGNLISGGRYWFPGPTIIDEGGNTFECDGSALVGQSPSVQSTCPWGFDNDASVGWDGVTECGNDAPCNGQGSPMSCTGTVDNQPVDPTEFCVSDGSGCIVTPTP